MREALRILGRRPLLSGFIAAAMVTASAAGWAGAQEDAAIERPLTEREQVEAAERALDEGRAAADRIQSLVEEARRERDLIRLTCLSDKQTQLTASLSTLEQRVENLRDAIRSGDGGLAGHELSVITVIRQKQDILAREVNQCIGQDVYETGDTSVEVTFTGDIPGSDATVIFAPGGFQVPMVPPPTSPLR